MKLSVPDLSYYLDVPTDTIRRWLQQGKLPVSKKGLNYQFNKRDLEKWAAKNQIKLDFSKPVPQAEEKMISLQQAIENGGVQGNIKGGSVSDVLGSSITGVPNIADANRPDLLEKILERETALSTGIGNGIAIPHPRAPLPYIEEPMVHVGFLDEPLDYQALDDKPVSILFLLLAPDLKIHLHLLSVLSFCLKNDRFVGFLKTQPDEAKLLETIKLLEQTYSI